MMQVCIVTGNGRLSDEEFQKKINSQIDKLENESNNIVIDIRFTEGVKGKTAYIIYRVDYPLWSGGRSKNKIPSLVTG
jgi:hypothetical protein